MDSTNAADLWDRVVGTQSAPSAWLVAAAGLVALAVVVSRAAWRIGRNAITIAHEGGHALVALLSGRRLDGIRLHSDTSGLTVSRGRPTGLGMIFTAAAGYTAPSLIGLAGAWLLAAHHITALLWSATALLAVMLLMIRNAYGVLTVVLSGAAFFLVSWLTGPDVQAAFGYLVVWFLLLGGVRPPFELQRRRRREGGRHFGSGGRGAGRPADSDPDQLARLTNVPATLWLLLFHAVSLSALIGGGRWLLGW